MKIIFRDNLSRYDFSLINLVKNDTFNFKVEKDDADYQFRRKSFEVNDKNIRLTRIDNELVAPVDGRTYYYVLENGRPILMKSRDWALYYTFITSRLDAMLLNQLQNDTTCFFRCIPKKPTQTQIYKTRCSSFFIPVFSSQFLFVG